MSVFLIVMKSVLAGESKTFFIVFVVDYHLFEVINNYSINAF